ncbi:hypothetical protein [Pseudomonas aeruginosa]|uniref:hypothetical protein n=1 Tax=Pseudomonas aeruginosa TaxID=287 RepID=UPI000B41C4B8|nr:hypothetical protein [Pseudomonas aeruginosa]OVY93354.1 hypothetical protein CDO42_25160 [Pseudomonas aeruginosa]RPO48076.1 hypothetical protein IPC1191_00555 [Pseudomonas aeruginosa]RPO59364.1 hypothetical protein IPC1190_00555 [Pseudomonas aeruginosa]
MSEVKRFDHVNHAHIDDCEHVESSEGAWVTASDYDALAAKLAMAEDAAEKGDAARHAAGGMEMEIEELRAELAELRARVAVVPERKLLNAGVPGLNRNSGWNACLDELARLNGMTVSEGLLRRVCAEQPATCCMDDEMSWRRDRDSALIELRALLNEDKENDDHAA